MQDKEYHDNHYAEMNVQPIEVMQEILSPESFNGFLLGSIVKYHLRAGHKAGEGVIKEQDKRNRFIAWLYHATKGAKINPRLEYSCPLYYMEDMISLVDKKAAEMAQARKYGEEK